MLGLIETKRMSDGKQHKVMEMKIAENEKTAAERERRARKKLEQ